MGLFRRKPQPQPIQEPVFKEPPHEHVWKDMPWYIECEYNGRDKTASYKVIEPYICISCGERKNVVLEESKWSNISVEEREREYTKVRKKYKRYVRPRAVVEDMINNILLVKDPQHLHMIELMRGTPHQNVGTSSTMMPLIEEKTPKIEVPET